MTIRGVRTEPNALRAPLEVHVDVATRATAEAVYAALADLRTHLDWGGERRPATMRLLTMDAPSGRATTGTEFATTGADPNGTFADRSVVTEAAQGRVFEFVTEAELTPKRGGSPVLWTVVHRYEIATEAGGSHVSYRFRVTRISRLIGPLRMLGTPLAGVLRRAWASFARRGLRDLVAAAEAGPHR